MAVTHLEITSRAPFAEGTAFGEVGPYERLDGAIHVAVDPEHPANSAIVDLDKAERDGEGRVRFRVDFCLLRPTDPSRGNRRLLFEVVNRGRRNLLRQFNRGANRSDPGDGFLMRHGWTLAWCGWQWDVFPNPALGGFEEMMGLEAPMALEAGRPIQGQVACEVQPSAPAAAQMLADRRHRPYPTADVDDPSATLTVREWPAGPWTTIARDRWRFARDEGGRPIADDAHIWLDGGFEPGKVYEVVYRTRISPVVGTGLLAMRDTVSFLRYGGDGNPCADRLDRAYAFGRSQSGRFQRHFLYLGLNLDEAGRQVFDGMMPLVAGGRRGQFNHRFAQPSLQTAVSFGHLGPYTDVDQTDPATHRTDGLLRRQREAGGLPKVFHLNTSAEYWRNDGSLIHTDLDEERDVEPPPEARIYHFGGTQHAIGHFPPVSSGEDSSGAHPPNSIDYSPLLRAALVNLDRWASDGVEPPPSAFPRLADGTAARKPEVLEAFRAIPGVRLPRPDFLVRTWRVIGLGPGAERGVGRYPAVVRDPYAAYAPAVDADGNELAGVRLPDVTVPLATYTGWNPRHPETGGEGQILNGTGSFFRFAADAEERRRTGDPRPAIDERYRDRDDYLSRVRAAAEELVAERHLLAEDLGVVLASAAERYDALAPARADGGRGGR